MALNLNSLMLGTDNKARLVDYYKEVLGEPMMDEGGYTGWMVGSSFINIGEHSEVHGSNKEPARAIWFFETSDVKGEFDRIKSVEGSKVIAEPYKPDPNGEFWLATIADPDGNYFQLASPWDTNNDSK
jgi:predicted enzyme related to lactoylglutathione lyase